MSLAIVGWKMGAGVVVVDVVVSVDVVVVVSAAVDVVVSADVVESVVGLAFVCTALAFLVFFALIAETGPVRATVITYVNPAVAAVLGVAVLNEELTRGMLVGFALVLSGCVLATGKGPEAVPEP